MQLISILGITLHRLLIESDCGASSFEEAKLKKSLNRLKDENDDGFITVSVRSSDVIFDA